MKINHKIFLLILPLISFFYLSPEVYAGTFSIHRPGGTSGGKYSYTCINYNPDTLEIINVDSYRASSSHATSKAGKCGSTYTHVMWNDSTKQYVYCSNRGVSFRSGVTYIDKDSIYQSEKKCEYEDLQGNLSWTYCNAIAGYIIDSAWDSSISGEKDDNRKWFQAQAAIWTYFAKYSNYFDEGHTTNADTVLDENEKVENIINEAFKRFNNSGAKESAGTKNDVSFEVETSESKFRFIPNGSECGAGQYVTRKIQIKNTESRDIDITVRVPHNAVSICQNDDNCIDKDTKGGELNVSLSANKTTEITLKTTNILEENINLRITASYKESTTITKSTPNTTRYTSDGVQGMLTYETKDKNKDGYILHETSKEINFSQVAVKHYTCPKTTTNNKNTNTYSSNTEGSPVEKVCANKAEFISKDTPDSNQYEVYFNDCSCLSLDLGDGRKVSLLLTEKVGFRFGSLTPTTVYPGGSFKLYNSLDSSTGITTGYKSEITWEYADWVGEKDNGYPYYYNPNDLANDNAKNIAEEITNKIKEKVLNKEISLQFESKDSNDEKNQENKVVPVTLSIENIKYDETTKTFTLDYNNGIQLNDSYFSVDGEVIYGTSDKNHTIEGGKEYYIPLHYLEETFPFNIKTTNLSALNSGNFWYQADCDVEVNTDNYLYDKENGIRYRSITVSKPFPKATKKSDLPFNWQEWYWESTSNQQRIKDSYKNYPSQPLYKITVDNERITKIRNITESYNSWSNIKSDGSSKFVVGEDNYFNTRANDTSYCPIGMFSDTCDK